MKTISVALGSSSSSSVRRSRLRLEKLPDLLNDIFIFWIESFRDVFMLVAVFFGIGLYGGSLACRRVILFSSRELFISLRFDFSRLSLDDSMFKEAVPRLKFKENFDLKGKKSRANLRRSEVIKGKEYDRVERVVKGKKVSVVDEKWIQQFDDNSNLGKSHEEYETSEKGSMDDFYASIMKTENNSSHQRRWIMSILTNRTSWKEEESKGL